MEKTWGFSWLLPFSCSVNWSDYINYLREYYKRLAPELLREVAANYPEVYPANRIGNLCAAANFCLKMEENLLSELRIRLTPAPNYMLPINTIIESSLIRNRAHSSFCPTGEEFSVASAVAFVCIALEADLMCESLRYGAKPTDDIIKQSSVIRLCALSLLNLKGDQSVLAAVAMLGIAKEVKMICDWVKKEKEPVNFSSSTPHELGESRFIRIRLLDVMTNIVLKSFFPSSEVSGRPIRILPTFGSPTYFGNYGGLDMKCYF